MLGRFIHCDGEGCDASAAMPIGLRSELAPAENGRRSAVDGWLFVTNKSGSRHFCPICGKLYLRIMRAEAKP